MMFRYFVSFESDRGLMNSIVQVPNQIYSIQDVENVQRYLSKSVDPPLSRVVMISFSEIKYRIPRQKKKP